MNSSQRAPQHHNNCWHEANKRKPSDYSDGSDELEGADDETDLTSGNNIIPQEKCADQHPKTLYCSTATNLVYRKCSRSFIMGPLSLQYVFQDTN